MIVYNSYFLKVHKRMSTLCKREKNLTACDLYEVRVKKVTKKTKCKTILLMLYNAKVGNKCIPQ